MTPQATPDRPLPAHRSHAVRAGSAARPPRPALAGQRDPYRVWLSEVMLQQTQVATVLDYYRASCSAFPTCRRWPRRRWTRCWRCGAAWATTAARATCTAARRWWWPSTAAAFRASSAVLATLPGIGRSTAAAIAAFCFGERCAILDGNVKRVLARALGFGGDLARPRHERALWQLAEALLPAARRIEAYTQGLMDLGATVCTRAQAACDACPLAALCVARAEGGPRPIR
jgi:A/G-specific adenine glycosylase